MDDWKDDITLLNNVKIGQFKEYAQRYVARDDMESIRQFFEAIKWHPPTRQEKARFWFLDTMLRNDKPELATPFFDPNAIKEWCNTHVTCIREECPKVFKAWASMDTMSIVAWSLRHCTVAQKLRVLSGQGATAQEQHVHDLLKANPQGFAFFDISWAGKRGSPLRQAAENLGWSRSLLATMVHTLHEHPTSWWGNVVQYPYSFVAASVLGQKPSNPGVKVQIKNKLRYLMLCKDAMTDVKANPKDIALARCVVLSAPASATEFSGHPKLKSISAQEQDDLARAVEVYASLDALDVLAEQLAFDTFDATAAVQEAALPDMELGL